MSMVRQSTNRPLLNTGNRVRTLSLFCFFPLLQLLHTCSIDRSSQASSGTCLSVIKSVVAKVNSSEFHEGLKTQSHDPFTTSAALLQASCEVLWKEAFVCGQVSVLKPV